MATAAAEAQGGESAGWPAPRAPNNSAGATAAAAAARAEATAETTSAVSWWMLAPAQQSE